MSFDKSHAWNSRFYDSENLFAFKILTFKTFSSIILTSKLILFGIGTFEIFSSRGKQLYFANVLSNLYLNG